MPFVSDAERHSQSPKTPRGGKASGCREEETQSALRPNAFLDRSPPCTERIEDIDLAQRPVQSERNPRRVLLFVLTPQGRRRCETQRRNSAHDSYPLIQDFIRKRARLPRRWVTAVPKSVGFVEVGGVLRGPLNAFDPRVS